MQKILITLKVPQIDKEYDVLIPINITVSEALELLQKSIIELSMNSYVEKKGRFLMDESTGYVLDNNVSIKKSGIKNGSNLILY